MENGKTETPPAEFNCRKSFPRKSSSGEKEYHQQNEGGQSLFKSPLTRKMHFSSYGGNMVGVGYEGLYGKQENWYGNSEGGDD